MTDLPLLPMLGETAPLPDEGTSQPPDAPAAAPIVVRLPPLPAAATQDGSTALSISAGTALTPSDDPDGPDAVHSVPAGEADAPDALIPLDTSLAGCGPAPVFRCIFAEQECLSRYELAMAMADAWDEARADLVTGRLAALLDETDLVAAAICRDQAASIASGRFTPDRGVLEAILLLSDAPLVVWRCRRYEGAADLGGSMLQALRGTGVIPAHCDSLVMSGAASVFADDAQRPALQAIETRYAAPDCTLREKTLLMYIVGFLLSGVAAFIMEGETFYTVSQLSAWLEARAKRSSAAFTRACHRLLDENHLLDPQLEAWLCAIGCRQEVARWQAEIDEGML